MELEIIFKGTPDQFLEVLEIYSIRQLLNCPQFSWRVDHEGHNFVQLYDLHKHEYVPAWIKVQSFPDQQAMLIVHFPDDLPAEVNPPLDQLVNELMRQGWVSHKPSTAQESSQATQNARPWEDIPDHLWDRLALKLWWDGHDRNYIAAKVHVSARTITKRISELRKLHGDKTVPIDDHRKKYTTK